MPYTQMLNNFTYAAPKLVIVAVTPLAVIGLLLVVAASVWQRDGGTVPCRNP